MKAIASLLSVVILLAACEQELYEKGDSVNSYTRADFVEAFVGSNKTIEYVVTDDGDRLSLKKPYTSGWIQESDTVYRSLMYYDQWGQEAEVLSLSRVTVLSVVNDITGKGKWKTDPVGLETIWVSKSKKYLNLGLLLKSGEITESQEKHKVGAVLNSITLNADSTYTVNMSLSHSQGDVPEYYTQRAYLSISLDGTEADSLRFTMNTYDGVVTKSFCLKSKNAKRQ